MTIEKSDKDIQTVYEVTVASEEKSVGDESARVYNEWGEQPTEEELRTLRKVSGDLPYSAWLVAIVELAERFTYYGLSGVFQNYMALDRTDVVQTGGLGWGQSKATALSNFFQFWCYVTPVGMALVADMKLGRYNTILLSSAIYVLGNIILVLTSIPSALEGSATAGRAGLIVAMIVIGLGTGGIKSNVGPLIADQYTKNKPFIKTMKNGERVIVDPAVTVQRIFMIFYWCINVGGLSSIATTELEKHVDFWAAYLLPAAFFFVAIVILVIGRNNYVCHPPTGSPIPAAGKVVYLTIKNAFKGRNGVKTHNKHFIKSFTYDAARPEVRASKGWSAVNWDNAFVDEVRRTLSACNVFLFYPIYWVVYNQMLNNFVSQAGVMQTHGIPNDIMQNIDSLALIVFIPIMDRFIYPGLARVGIKMLPMTRIFLGFIFGAGSMAYAAGVQKLIYDAGPCYDAPMACPAAGPDFSIPNDVHVAVQTPAYVLIALSEIFASITGLEYAYTKSPPAMKSLVMSLFLLQNAFGAILGICIASTAVDPKLLTMYWCLAISATVAGILFWLFFGKLNKVEEEYNAAARGDSTTAYEEKEIRLEAQAAGGHAIADNLEPMVSAISHVIHNHSYPTRPNGAIEPVTSLGGRAGTSAQSHSAQNIM